MFTPVRAFLTTTLTTVFEQVGHVGGPLQQEQPPPTPSPLLASAGGIVAIAMAAVGTSRKQLLVLHGCAKPQDLKRLYTAGPGSALVELEKVVRLQCIY